MFPSEHLQGSNAELSPASLRFFPSPLSIALSNLPQAMGLCFTSSQSQAILKYLNSHIKLVKNKSIR